MYISRSRIRDGPACDFKRGERSMYVALGNNDIWPPAEQGAAVHHRNGPELSIRDESEFAVIHETESRNRATAVHRSITRVYEPSNSHGRQSAIVWIHRFASATLDWFDPGIQYFVDHGFVVLAPN